MSSLSGLVVFIAALLLSAHQASGTPILTTSLNTTGTELGGLTREHPRIYACQNEQWIEPCEEFTASVGECFNFATEWNDKVSSIKNQNKESFICYWYEHANCEGQVYCNQEDAKLQDGNGFFNDRITSWSCIYPRAT